MSFSRLTKQEFVRFIINDERSLSGVLHRKEYMRIMVQWITYYLRLSKNTTVEVIEKTLAEIYFEVKLKRIDTAAVHLHNEAFNRAIKHGIAAKKEEVKARREKQMRENELNNHLIGLA